MRAAVLPVAPVPFSRHWWPSAVHAAGAAQCTVSPAAKRPARQRHGHLLLGTGAVLRTPRRRSRPPNCGPFGASSRSTPAPAARASCGIAGVAAHGSPWRENAAPAGTHRPRRHLPPTDPHPAHRAGIPPRPRPPDLPRAPRTDPPELPRRDKKTNSAPSAWSSTPSCCGTPATSTRPSATSRSRAPSGQDAARLSPWVLSTSTCSAATPSHPRWRGTNCGRRVLLTVGQLCDGFSACRPRLPLNPVECPVQAWPLGTVTPDRRRIW